MTDIRLTQEELDAMPAKTKKHRHVMDMYLAHDYITAYAKHTDDRVNVGGPESAVGAVHDWERLGQAQIDWLIECGMEPEHTLLDVGCGTGRLARKAAPYLDQGHYTGIELSSDSVKAAVQLADDEGWSGRNPRFVVTKGGVPKLESFDFVWAFSVFIHLPYEIMEQMFRQIALVMHKDSTFMFSWCDEKYYVRSGLKQFRHTRDMYEHACARAGLTFEKRDGWTGGQLMAVAKLASSQK